MTKLDEVISSKRPFTTFISAKYILDRFNGVEQKYLTSEYGSNDLKQILKYLIITKPIYLDNHPVGETSCKSIFVVLLCSTFKNSVLRHN